MEHQEIERRFRHHPPTTPEHVQAHEAVREAFRELAHEVNDGLPEGREKSLVLTHLEEGLMWANAGLARARADTHDAGKATP